MLASLLKTAYQSICGEEVGHGAAVEEEEDTVFWLLEARESNKEGDSDVFVCAPNTVEKL